VSKNNYYEKIDVERVPDSVGFMFRPSPRVDYEKRKIKTIPYKNLSLGMIESK